MKPAEERRKDQMVNWVWRLLQSDGSTPVVVDGSPVQYVAETSTATGKQSTAAGWFSAHIKRPFDNQVDDLDEVMEECKGKRVMLIITDKLKDGKPTGYKKTDVFRSGV